MRCYCWCWPMASRSQLREKKGSRAVHHCTNIFYWIHKYSFCLTRTIRDHQRYHSSKWSTKYFSVLYTGDLCGCSGVTQLTPGAGLLTFNCLVSPWLSLSGQTARRGTGLDTAQDADSWLFASSPSSWSPSPSVSSRGSPLPGASHCAVTKLPCSLFNVYTVAKTGYLKSLKPPNVKETSLASLACQHLGLGQLQCWCLWVASTRENTG